MSGELSRRFLLGAGAAGVAFGAAPALAQATCPPRSRVDADGVWRWADGREVALFGVNYNIASASAFRFAEASGVPFERIVDQDFSHFIRLGFNALRLSFWGDWETSTADGTVVANRHLDVLDLVVARADEAGMSCLLSPIVTYGGAWPDALDSAPAGLSGAFAKDKLGTDPVAIAAQVRYLGQLLSRTNRLTGRRYADEPAIAAVEPINEPTHHSADRAGSIRYIDALAAAVRSSGFQGPIVYNVTQDMAMAPAIAAADVQGATFAWYPTGLQAGHAVAGNGLLLVDEYPQFHDAALARRAKLVYEFDAADSMASYFYPAMVREFRGGGAQFAAMFAYDAMAIAAANSEFNDHFLNLAYTPAKAISAMIAGVAMRELPRGGRYGRCPEDKRFAAFRVDDSENVSEFVDATRFYHSNDTNTHPAAAGLEHLAGCGSSPLVAYDGTGAWFLDRIAAGVWRLEVYPDTALVANPFAFRRPSRAAVRIVARNRRLRIDLPDLGDAFLVAGADGGAAGRAQGGAIEVMPGVYRLSRVPTRLRVDRTFHAPPGEQFAPILQHMPPASITDGKPWRVSLSVVASTAPTMVSLKVRTRKRFLTVPLEARGGFGYAGTVPASAFTLGFLDYYVAIDTGESVLLSPGEDGALPGDWDFGKQGGYRVPVVAADAPLTLFEAGRDGEMLVVPYGGYSAVAGIDIVPDADGDAVLRLDGNALAAAAYHDLPAQRAWNGALDVEGRDLGSLASLVVTGRSVKAATGRAMVILIERDGMAWGATLSLSSSGGVVDVPLAALKPVQAAMLPRDFPVGINPYWLRVPAGRGGAGDGLRLAELQAVQVTLGERFLGRETPVVEIARIALAR